MPDNHLNNPLISIIIPVYNEESGLPALFKRLYPAIDKLNRPIEIIFINDGSKDRSAALLRTQFEQRPLETRVILLARNVGQHMAIMAGFQEARGDYILTMDADLQNPPEEIIHLIETMDQGYDYVGTIRANRQDTTWRRWASKAMNRFRERITKIKMTDQGCMLRAYDRRIIQAILSCREINTFIPALAHQFSTNPTEVIVQHEERVAGESKYSLYSLIRLNFDLVTGFSVMPLQWFSMLGMTLSFISGILVIYLIGRRLIVGPEVEGVFTLFAITFFLISILLFGVGLLGEYIGRIYQQVRERPRYTIEAILEQTPEKKT